MIANGAVIHALAGLLAASYAEHLPEYEANMMRAAAVTARDEHDAMRDRIIALEAFVRRCADGDHPDEIPEEARDLLHKGEASPAKRPRGEDPVAAAFDAPGDPARTPAAEQLAKRARGLADMAAGRFVDPAIMLDSAQHKEKTR